MTEKKPYSQPQLFRVDLNHEQAILSVCSLATMAALGNSNKTCRSTGTPCKKGDTAFGAGNSGPRAS